MRCEEAMTRELQTVSRPDPVRLAALRMRDANVGFLPVLEADGSVAGVVTDRDLAVRVLASGLGPDTAVERVMSADVVSCAPDDEMEDALLVMRDHQLSRLLVLDPADRMLGVVSLADFASDADESLIADTMRRITEREARAPGE